MKHTVLLFLCLIISICINAQELKVKSMELHANDISASSGKYSRNDSNGDPCALVKVRLAVSGANFSGDISGTVENHEGEYWVYLCSGAKMLKVRHRDYIALDVNFRDYGIKGVEGKKTYVLTILKPNTGRSVDEIQQYVATGRLKVDFEPVGAEVWLNDTKLGTSPNVFQNIKAGAYNMEVRANGYTTVKRNITIEDGKTTEQNGTLQKIPVMSSYSTTTSSPETITVHGTVVDKHGEGIIGASIIVVGSHSGCVTDLDGNFKIAARENSQITVSYIGYQTSTIIVSKNSNTNYRIVLKEDRTYSRFGFGLCAGMNISSVTDVDDDSKISYQAGIDMWYSFGYKINHLGLQSGLTYSSKGTKSYDAQYIHFPLQLYYNFGTYGISFRVLAGVYAAYGIGGNYFDNGMEAEPFDYGMQFGLQLATRKYGLNRLYIKGNYELGLRKQLFISGINKNDNVGQNRNLSITLGYRF